MNLKLHFPKYFSEYFDYDNECGEVFHDITLLIRMSSHVLIMISSESQVCLQVEYFVKLLTDKFQVSNKHHK